MVRLGWGTLSHIAQACADVQPCNLCDRKMADPGLVRSSLPLAEHEAMTSADVHGVAEFILIASALVTCDGLKPLGKRLVESSAGFPAALLRALVPWVLAA